MFRTLAVGPSLKTLLEMPETRRLFPDLIDAPALTTTRTYRSKLARVRDLDADEEAAPAPFAAEVHHNAIAGIGADGRRHYLRVGDHVRIVDGSSAIVGVGRIHRVVPATKANDAQVGLHCLKFANEHDVVMGWPRWCMPAAPAARDAPIDHLQPEFMMAEDDARSWLRCPYFVREDAWSPHLPTPESIAAAAHA
jgi:hypothetical protein